MKRPLGYDVDDNAIRFSNYFHVLRELVHFTNGWMPLEPSWERKYALGDHVHDDARALTKIKRRLYELRNPSEYPGSPSPELEQLLDRMAAARSAQEYLARRLHGGEAGAGARDADPPRHRSTRWPTSRRCGCSPRSWSARSATRPAARAAIDADIGALPVLLRAEPRELRILPPLDEPARDDFVEVTEQRRPVPRARALRERRREPRADRARGAAALLPRADGRGAVRRRADGAQLARAPGDAVGLPRGHGAPELGRGAPRAAARPADEGRAGLRVGRLRGRASRTSSRSTPTTCSAGCASSTARASSGRCGATRTGARR